MRNLMAPAGKGLGKLVSPLDHDSSLGETVIIARPAQLVRTLEAIKIEMVQRNATAQILVRNREARTGSLLTASERRGHTLAELGLSRAERPFQADDRPRLDQSGDLAAQAGSFLGRLAEDTIRREQFVEQRFSICHGKMNLVRWAR